MDKKRYAQMIKLRKAGLSLQAIGDIYQITRERVRQIVGHIKRQIKSTPAQLEYHRRYRAAHK